MIELAKILYERIRRKIRDYDKDILNKYPVKKYLQYLEKYPEICKYSFLTNDVEEYYNQIIKRANNQIMELYHQLVLISLILKDKDRLKSQQLPNEVKFLYNQNFRRILKTIQNESNEPNFYLYRNDKFFKDLSVCTMKLIPIGPRKIHLDKLPLRFLVKNGLKQFTKAIIYITFELGGIKPFFNMHTDSHDPDAMAEFNREGWTRAFKRLAEIFKMEKNKKVKGLFAASWFYDPQLANISPRLNFTRDIMLNNGGVVYNLGPATESVKRNALLKSPTRRKLYTEGKYKPMNYLIIWPRKAILDWYKKNK